MHTHLTSLYDIWYSIQGCLNYLNFGKNLMIYQFNNIFGANVQLPEKKTRYGQLP